MGFSWRGKRSEQPVNDDDAAVASGADAMQPEQDLKAFKKMHQWDPFLDVKRLDAVDEVLADGDVEKEAAVEASLLAEDSPYAEVRAAVRPVDDPDLPVSTIRAWTIGFMTCTLVAGANILLGLRRAPIAITANVVLLVAYPLGAGWAAVMPDINWTMFGHQFSLNPGPFNQKEHMLITIMTAAGAAQSYAIYILQAQEIFYGQYFQYVSGRYHLELPQK